MSNQKSTFGSGTAYPEPTRADRVVQGVQAATALIPVVGGALNELVDAVLGAPVARRRDEWLKELGDVVQALRIGDAEKAIKSDAFQTAAIQASRIALGTHRREKRTMLRNALVNVGASKVPNEDLQEVFLRLVEDLTVSHVRVLEFLWRGGSLAKQGAPQRNINSYRDALTSCVRDLAGQGAPVEQIIYDLRARGLTRLSDANLPYPQSSIMTNHGINFLNFVLAPVGIGDGEGGRPDANPLPET